MIEKVRRGRRSKMEWLEVALALAVGLFGFAVVCGLLRRCNEWFHERELGEEVREKLPPGDMGWPLVGNMWSFLWAFKTGKPDAFIGSFVKRFGRTGIYKAFMFGSPTILVTTPETCKQVLMDDERFAPGWPSSTLELIGRKSFLTSSREDHKWLRRVTAAPVNGHDALSAYLVFIERAVVADLETWSAAEREVEFLTELRRLTFRIIMRIFLSSEGDAVARRLEEAYADLNLGVRAMAIDLPGFAYHRARKARRKLVKVLQSAVDARRQASRDEGTSERKKDMMDQLLEAGDEGGRKLDDEEIIDVLLMYLNAGHESSAHTIMWTAIFLQENPEMLRKAKEEQEEIRKNMRPEQEGLELKDYRKMVYLAKVIDEVMRVISFSLMAFRQALTDVTINGYTIPKGWKVQVWNRNVHLDPEVYPHKTKEFDPSRWDGYTPKPGSFIPFGAGARLCPGNDLAKLEISVFIHHFLLNYELERLNPQSPVQYLPHTRPLDSCRARIKRISPQSS